jgi:PQQ enzyme repeat
MLPLWYHLDRWIDATAGNGGAEYGVRGYVWAYDAATGKLAWRSYTVPGDPSKPGFVRLRSGRRPSPCGHRRRLALEPQRPQPRWRRQPVPLLHPGPESRHGRVRDRLTEDDLEAIRHCALAQRAKLTAAK